MKLCVREITIFEERKRGNVTTDFEDGGLNEIQVYVTMKRVLRVISPSSIQFVCIHWEIKCKGPRISQD